jgi:hypothetical protein
LTAEKWQVLLSAIYSADQYVALNLSACTSGTQSSGSGLYADGTFDPNYSTSTGKDLVVSLVLPDTAKAILDNTNYSSSFSSLAEVSGTGIVTIGERAFYNCTSLTSVSFPVATSIGVAAFYS